MHTTKEVNMHPIIKVLLTTLLLLVSSTSFAAEVTRAIFTIGIDNREPVLDLDSIDSSTYTTISFFTELKDLSGHNITHQWRHDDKIMFEKTFEVKGPRWRVWTSKTLIPSWTGQWTVKVLDDDRSELASRSFEYQ
jgi:hypothetical protein